MNLSGGRARGRPKSFHDKTESATIQSLDRALKVLSIVAAGNGMSLTEVAATGRQSTATCYRILTTFKKHHIVEFDDHTQLWHIGAEAFRIGSSFLRRTRIVDQSRQVMERLMIKTGETVNLAIIDRREITFIGQIETHEPIRAFFRLGTRSPVHASGIGKAIMAFQSEVLNTEILKKLPLEKFTANTIIDSEALANELRNTYQRGWAIDDEEKALGMRCIAAPIFNQNGEAVAGISVSGPTVRMTQDLDNHFGRLVRIGADEITISMGGRLPHSTS